jgi:phage tail protein X
MASVKVAREDMTLDLVVWQALGRQDDQLVERTLDLNPGIGALGDILPVGTIVALPELARRSEPSETVRLWS